MRDRDRETASRSTTSSKEGPGAGMVAACTSGPNGERNREPEERRNIPDAPHFKNLKRAHKHLRDTAGREPPPMGLKGEHPR